MSYIEDIREGHDEFDHFQRLAEFVSFEIADEAAFLALDRLLAARRGETRLARGE